jgi:hypothetical protein
MTFSSRIRPKDAASRRLEDRLIQGGGHAGDPGQKPAVKNASWAAGCNFRRSKKSGYIALGVASPPIAIRQVTSKLLYLSPGAQQHKSDY